MSNKDREVRADGSVEYTEEDREELARQMNQDKFGQDTVPTKEDQEKAEKEAEKEAEKAEKASEKAAKKA